MRLTRSQKEGKPACPCFKKADLSWDLCILREIDPITIATPELATAIHWPLLSSIQVLTIMSVDSSDSSGRTTQSTSKPQSRASSSTTQSTSSKSESRPSSSKASSLRGPHVKLEPVDGPSWTIKESPLIAAGGGTGKGMFATRLISAGEVILTDMPMLMLKSPYANGEDDPVWSIDDRPHEIPPKDVYKAFKKLSTDDQLYCLTVLSHVATSDKQLLNSAKDVKLEAKSHDELIEAGKILAIWENNVLQAEGELQILCRNVSRINHSCVPNAVHTWVSQTVRSARKAEEYTGI